MSDPFGGRPVRALLSLALLASAGCTDDDALSALAQAPAGAASEARAAPAPGPDSPLRPAAGLGPGPGDRFAPGLGVGPGSRYLDREDGGARRRGRGGYCLQVAAAPGGLAELDPPRQGPVPER